MRRSRGQLVEAAEGAQQGHRDPLLRRVSARHKGDDQDGGVGKAQPSAADANAEAVLEQARVDPTIRDEVLSQMEESPLLWEGMGMSALEVTSKLSARLFIACDTEFDAAQIEAEAQIEQYWECAPEELAPAAALLTPAAAGHLRQRKLSKLVELALSKRSVFRK